MKVRVQQSQESLDFDDLGRTLELLDGERGRLGVAFKHRGEAALLGGIEGTLHLATQGELDAALAETDYEPPRGAVKRGERAYLLEVGDFAFAISSAEYVGAGYQDRQLTVHVGSLLLSLSFGEEGE